MRQVIGIGEVEACFMNFQRLKHIDEECFVVAISVICRQKKRHHFGFGNLVQTMLTNFTNSLPLGYHNDVKAL